MGPFVFYNQLQGGPTPMLVTWPLYFLCRWLFTLLSVTPDAGPGFLVQLAGYGVHGFVASLFSHGYSSSNETSHQSPRFKYFQLILEAFGMKWEVEDPKMAISTPPKSITRIHTHFSRDFLRTPGTLRKDSLIVLSFHFTDDKTDVQYGH